MITYLVSTSACSSADNSTQVPLLVQLHSIAIGVWVVAAPDGSLAVIVREKPVTLVTVAVIVASSPSKLIDELMLVVTVMVSPLESFTRTVYWNSSPTVISRASVPLMIGGWLAEMKKKSLGYK